MRGMKHIAVAGLVALYLVTGLAPSWEATRAAKGARDYATYHYAVQEAVGGGDPYDTRALGQRGKSERTRTSVHPYFYPPPFLLGMLWAVPLSLSDGVRAFYWLNQACLVGLGLVFWRWFRAPWVVLAFILATFSPIPDNAKMGQANLPVLLLASLGLWWRSGLLVAGAAMAKMSPALYLCLWAVRRNLRPVLVAGLTAAGLSLSALWLVPLELQERFYTEILPGFSRGSYHGLRVPITLPANHSIPDLFNQAFGPGRFELPVVARRLSGAVTVVLLAGICWWGRARRDALGEAALAGALTVLLVITPVYTYEHHLVLLLLPLAVVGTALWRGRLGRAWWPLAALSYVAIAWPLWLLRATQKALPDGFGWWLQESKFFGIVGLLLLCLAAAARRGTRMDATSD